MNLYFITTIRTEERIINGNNIVDWDSRTVAFYKTLERAKECLIYNHGDLNEAGYYPWAVIESVPDGLYPVIDQEESLFWEWVGEEEGCWQPMTKPPEGMEWQNYYTTMPKRWGSLDFDIEKFVAFATVG